MTFYIGNPPGTVKGYAGTTVPDGWLICDGSNVSRSTYADLYAAIGTTYGTGDGVTTFGLPDTRGRVLVGVSPSGKSAVQNLGNNEGLAANLRDIDHHHSFNVSPFAAGSGNYTINPGGSGFNTSGDSDNSNKPAYITLQYIIKF